MLKNITRPFTGSKP